MATNLVGRIIGKYRVDELIGRGGMAEVYKAYHPGLDRHVAIKVMHSFLVDEKDFMTRFQREARVVAGMRHPNIVQVYDFDVEAGMPYMVMEYVDGEALKDRLQRLQEEGQWLSLDETVRITLVIGSALRYAHRLGMVHRDVKPANVMIDSHGDVILTDFGIAKILSGGGGTQLTASGAMVGTPSYMAPEQGMGQPGDVRSDIYSLGVMLYQLATGRLPFEADTPLAVVIKHVNDPLPLPRNVNTELPEAIEMVIVRALAKNPDERYQTVDEMLADLRRAMGMPVDETPVESLTLKATPPPPIRKPSARPSLESTTVAGRRRLGWLPWAGAAAVLVALALGGALLVMRPANSVPTPTPAPTDTAQPTATVTPSPTAAPASTHTPTLTPKPSTVSVSVRRDQAGLYQEPDESTFQGGLNQGTALVALGRTAAGDWIKIQAQDGTQGWMQADSLDLGVFSVNDIPEALVLIKPTATPDLAATQAACKPLAELDATPSPAQVKVNEKLSVTWRVKNTGNCAFDEGSSLVHTGGTWPKLGTQSVPAIKPGESQEMGVELVAPALGGLYSIEWEFHRADGSSMGQFKQDVTVIGPTATRAPTLTPRPTLPPTAAASPTSDPNLIGPVGSGDLQAVWGGTFWNCVATPIDEQGGWKWEADFFIEVYGGNSGYQIDSPACHWDFGQNKYACRWGAREGEQVIQSVTVTCPGYPAARVSIVASADRKGNTCVQK
ncbi:MAG: protein kinase [Thermoflexales bacterium]|nr:protein kinase [Thermoflexales bacterium]